MDKSPFSLLVHIQVQEANAFMYIVLMREAPNWSE